MFSQLKWRKTILFFFILLLFLFLFYLLHVTAFTQKKEKEKKIEQTESDIKDCLCSVLYIEQV